MKNTAKFFFRSLPEPFNKLERVSSDMYFYISNLHIHVPQLIRSLFYYIYVYKLTNREFEGLNIGSGSSLIQGFLNIDANPISLADIVADTERLKLNTETVSKIYTSHVFEHIPKAKAKDVLTEWYRLLKPGGELYICVPDLEALAKLFLENIETYHTQEGRYKADLSAGVMYGGQGNKYDFHYFGYSFVTLKAMLEDVGFKDIQRFDRSQLEFCHFLDAASAKIENVSVSLNIKGVK